MAKKSWEQYKDYLVKKTQFNSLGLNSLGNDIKLAFDGVSTYFGGWQDSAAAANQRTQLEGMRQRLAEIKKYFNTNSADFDSAQIEEYLKGLDDVDKSFEDALSHIDSQAEIYSGFKSADEYSAALAAYEKNQQYASKYSGIDSITLNGYASELRSAKKAYDSLSMMSDFAFSSKSEKEERKKQLEAVFKKYGTDAASAFEYADGLEGYALSKYTDMFADKTPDEISAFAEELRAADREYQTKLGEYGQALDRTGEPYFTNKRDYERFRELEGMKLSEKYGISADSLSDMAASLDKYSTFRKVDDLQKWAEQQKDFESFTKFDSDVLKKTEKDYNGNLGYWQEYINQTKLGARLATQNRDAMSIDPDFQTFGKMKDDEVRVFNYLMNTERFDEAFSYANNLKPLLKERETAALVERAEKDAREYPWLSTLSSVVINVTTGPLAGLENIASMIFTGKINEHSALNRLGKMSDTIRATVPQAWAEKYNWDEGTAGTVNFLYQTGTSIVDNVASSLVFGGYSGTKLGKTLSLGAMGLTAEASTVRAAKAKGATDAQAFALGVIGGAIEIVTEKVPLENLLKIKGKPNIAKAITGQIITEAGEEAAAEIVNTVADIVIMAQKSDLQLAVNKYMEEGLSAEEATSRAFWDTVGNIGLAALGGGISGGILGSAFSLINVGSTKIADADLGAQMIRLGSASDIVAKGLSFGEGSEAYELADKLNKRSNHRADLAKKKAANSQTLVNENEQGEAGAQSGIFREVTDSADIGKLYRLIVSETKQQYLAATAKDYEKKLSGMGVKAPKKLSEAVAASVAGERLTDSQIKLISRSKEAQELIAASETLLDLSTEWNVLQPQTKYKTDEGMVLIQRVGGGSSRYNVSFVESESISKTVLKNADGDDTIKADINDGGTEYAGQEAEAEHDQGRTKAADKGSYARALSEAGNGRGISEEVGASEKYVHELGSRKRELSKVKKRFSEAAFVLPQRGTLEAEAKNELSKYGIEGYIVKKSAWDRDVPAFSNAGRIYIREGIEENYRKKIIPHEATHVMKQLSYKPYLDFVEKTPDMIDIYSESAQYLIDHVLERGKIDLLDMSDSDITDLYDEINSTVYGDYVAGNITGELLDICNEIFYDFDSYIKELSAIHEQFKKDNTAANGNERSDIAERGPSRTPILTESDAKASVTPKMRELRGRTIPQVEAIVKSLREGASFGTVASGVSALSTEHSGEFTYESAKAAGVSDHGASMLAALSDAFSGDLRIYFDETDGDRRGVYRLEHDGTRSIVINPRSVADMNEVITHEIFHDLEATPAGREFIRLAEEYAKSRPTRSNAKFADAANRYEQIKKLYESDGRTKKEDIPGEVGAKVAAELIGKESTLEAILDRMGEREASAFAKKLKRAASAIKQRLSKVDKKKVRGAGLAERRAEMMLELYTRAAQQRAVRNTLDNPTVEPKKAENGSKGGERAENPKLTTINDEKMHVNEESSQTSEEKSQKTQIEKQTTQNSSQTSEIDNKKASREERGDIGEKVVIEIESDEELENRIANSERSRSRVLRDYLIEKFAGHTFVLSDGREAIMDNTDAKELSQKAGPKKTAKLSNLEKIIENAVPSGEAYNVDHPKFTEFHYYSITVKYQGAEMDILINVGLGKNDAQNHIYRLDDDKKKGQAPTHYGVSGPVGDRIKSAYPTNSIPQKSDLSTENEKSDLIEDGEDVKATVKRKPTATYKAYSVSHMQEILKGVAKLITSDALAENWQQGDPYFVNIKTGGIPDIARQLSELYNLAAEKGATDADIRRIASAAAEQLIANTYADDADFAARLTEEQDLASRALYALSHGIRRMRIGEIEAGDILHVYGKKAGRGVLSRWRATKNAKGTISPSEIANELAELGVPLSVKAENAFWAEADIMISLNELYVRSRAIMDETVRSQIGTAEEYTALRDKLTDQIIDAYREGEADVRVAKAQAAAKVMIDAHRAVELSRRKRDSGALASSEWKSLVKSIGDICKTYNISVPAVRDFAAKYKGFIATQASTLHALLENVDGENENVFNAYIEAKSTGDNQLLDAIDPKIARGIYAIAEGDGSTALTADELEALHAGLRNLLALDNRYNRVFKEGRWQDTASFAKTAIGESKSYYGDRTAKGDAEKGKAPALERYFNSTEDPEYVAARIGGYNRDGMLPSAVHELKLSSIEAQYKEMQYMEAVEAFFSENKEFRKRYRDHRIELKYVRENPLSHEKAEGSVTLSLGEFLSLYMTSKRKHAFISLAMSDINFAAKPGIRKQTATLRGLHPDLAGLDETQIEAITRGMGNALITQIQSVFEAEATAEDRAFVALVEKFFAEDSTRDKRDTDLLLYGYTNVIDGYYYPISRDKNAFDVNLIGNDRIIDSLVGVNSFSFNKATVERANKTMLIRDALSVMKNHAHQLAVYSTMTVPLQNLNRIYNCNVGGADGSLKSYISEHVSVGFARYLRNYLLDVQGAQRDSTDDLGASELLSKLKSGYAKSVLALNAKSIATQFSTLFAMQSKLSYSAWAKGLAMGASISRTEGENGDIMKRFAEMDKYSHAAAVRNDSNEQYLATGAIGKLGGATDKLMIGQLITDRATCLTMFYMCQYEVERRQGLAVGTAENKAAAGKLLDDMILEYQDTSGAATKTSIARSKNEIASSFAMFRSAELKSWSRLAYGAGEMRAKGAKGRKKAYAKELAAFFSSKLYAVALALIWKALRGRWEEDEEGKPREIWKASLEELFIDLVGFVPIAGDIAESALTFFDVETPSESAINDGITAIKSFITLFGDVIEDFSDGRLDTLGKHTDKLMSSLSGIGQIFGIPVRNVKNFCEIIITGVSQVVPSDQKYKAENTLYSKNYTEDLKEAIKNGDDALAATIIDMMMYDRTDSSAGHDAASEIADLYASGEEGLFPSKIGTKITVKIDGESREIELSAEEQKKLRAEYGKSAGAVKKLISSKSYERLTTSERATAIRDMYSLYMARAKTKLHGADMTSAVAIAEIISEGKFIPAYAHIKAIKKDEKIKNKKTQIETYLRSLGLSLVEQRVILYAAGYRSEENRQAVIRALRSAGLSAKEKKAVQEVLGLNK